MRIATVFVFSAIGLGGSAAHAADVAAVSMIDAVTVFPSGAEVTRLARVKLTAGEQRVVLADLPAQAIPGSIRVEGRSAGKFDIGSVDSRRLFVAASDPAVAESERKRIEDQIEALNDTKALFEGQVQAAEIQRKLLANLAEMPKVPAGAQASAGQPVDWKAMLATIGAGTAEAKRNEIDGRVKLRETDRKIKELHGKLAALAPTREQRTEVAVNVVAGADLEAEMTVRYQVPSASWAALYDARLSTGSKTAPPSLGLTRRASITQNTGEPWTNIALALSTTRPTVGASAPDLATMTVDYVPDAPQPVPMSAPAPALRGMMKAAKPAAAGAAGEAKERGEISDNEPVDAVMQDARERNAQVVQAPFQAIYAVPGRVSVAPTGEMKRVQLMEEQIEPALFVRTAPRLDAKAYLYAKLVLPKSSPMLPGAVSLFRDGTFVGTTILPLLAPGEDHDLGLGADDAIRVKHAIVEDKRGEKGLISSSKTDTRTFKITVKNLHERAMAVTVQDTLPVSQQQDIKVTLNARPQPTKSDVDDKRGVLSWESKLDPDQEQVIEFGYQVVWPGAKSITYGP